MKHRHPPPPGLRRLLWTYQIKLEAAWGLELLENWEKAMIATTFLTITLFFWWSVLKYYPSHLSYLSRRFAYYVFDDETVDLGGLLREWLWEKVGVVSGYLGAGAGPTSTLTSVASPAGAGAAAGTGLGKVDL